MSTVQPGAMGAPECRTLLIGYDGTSVGEDALALGVWLAEATGDRLLVAGVYPAEPLSVLPGIGADWVREMHASAETVLARARSMIDDVVFAQYRAVPASSVARGLDALALDADADMIIVGSNHRGVLRRIGIGKTAGRLLHGSAVPVMIAPRGGADSLLPEPETVGCAFVPTPEGERALDRAADLALRAGARLRIFTVVAHSVEMPDVQADPERAIIDHARSSLRQAADRACASVSDRVDASVEMLDGGVVDALSALDPADCQVLVCGSRGYGPVGRVLLGGVSSRLVRRAACPVMVVPRPTG